jgi:hypothetical protein
MDPAPNLGKSTRDIVPTPLVQGPALFGTMHLQAAGILA